MVALKFFRDFNYELERGKTLLYKGGCTYRDVSGYVVMLAISSGAAVEVKLNEQIEKGPWHEDRELVR